MIEPYYQDERVTIYCGDCREILLRLSMVDLVLTDPPYGIGADAHQGPVSSGWKQYGNGGWDNKKPDAATLQNVISAGKNAIVWGGNYLADVLPPSMGWIVWNKMQRGFSLADGELAWTSFNKALRIADISRAEAVQDVKRHPTQKSESLMKFCINYADNNSREPIKTIMDPFCGSGTTLRAAKDMGRQSIGIEICEAYCEVAANRMQQGVLF